MAVKVIDFHIKDTLRVHDIQAILMKEAKFTLLVEINRKTKELVVLVPKKFHFRKRPDLVNKFKYKKLREYEVLTDYLVTNKEVIQCKWHLSSDDFTELMLGLRLCLYRNYSLQAGLKKIFMVGKGMLDLFVLRIKRGLMK